MSEMSNFQEMFDEHFKSYKNVPIAIYGIGRNAELILKNVTGYNFVSLIATDHIGHILYGKKVVSIDEAIKQAKLILIAAIPSSTSIIYSRIKDIISPDICVFDMRGYRLDGDIFYEKNKYWKKSLKELYELIDTHDVISFDVFDTLIMRRTLEPRDAFVLIEETLNERGVKIPFAEWRIAAEKRCYELETSPTIDTIYMHLGSEYGLDEELLQIMQAIEIDIEKSLVCKRASMVETLEYALNHGKKIYLTTDMYLRKNQIISMLEKCGICGYHELLVSCEFGASKANGSLYEVIKKKEKNTRILHIGDNYEVDGVQAQKMGIKTYIIMSGYTVLASSSISYLLDEIRSFDDKLLLGYVVSTIFNNPFVLNVNKGKMSISSYATLANCFVPITILFLSFIIEIARKYDVLLFAARDGYFLHKLYERIREDRGDLPPAYYFYASRSAVSSSAILKDDDIKVLCSKVTEDLTLNLKEFMRNQFQIEVTEEFDLTNGKALEKWGIEETFKKIYAYKDVIMEKAQNNRERYLRYIKKLRINGMDKLAIVDIVTQGTLVYGLSNILQKNVDLIAMGTSAIPNNYVYDLNRVHCVYGNVNEKCGDIAYSLSEFSEFHLFIEMLYASTEGQFLGFSESGDILTLENSEYDKELLENTQRELMRLIEEIVKVKKNWSQVSNEFAVAVLRILYSKYSLMSKDLRKMFLFEDPYDGALLRCNLMDTLP